MLGKCLLDTLRLTRKAENSLHAVVFRHLRWPLILHVSILFVFTWVTFGRARQDLALTDQLRIVDDGTVTPDSD